MRLLYGVASAVVAAILAALAKGPTVTFMLGRFFRDVSRFKARRRLYGNANAMVPFFLGYETPPVISEPDVGLTVTPDELESADGADGAPAYISIRGRVYDVSAGASFYGPGKSYHGFVGKDATRAFAKGCTAPRCLLSSMEGLTPKELKEVDRWVELYETHDKYTFVGMLVADPVEDLVDQLVEGDAEADAAEQRADDADDADAREGTADAAAAAATDDAATDGDAADPA
ncbi:cytochrome b5-like heme/steroid binding domain-containing protein [Pelagophyceae sp. CCMP2097]|nr:cytochrome b5-like heme/steroid binding domain-containing protein [Pelagophyceae sp. CCMP2097]|mmetsp:Transcript_16882/g.57105  ORF Transcript_16882/g.57105 Transcript_16882/m.57105 type:complete len:231 (-) Transcript_16882:40-732(-)